MFAHPLPDGRVPVLLSAHDEKLIGQDAGAILDYLDRTAQDTDLTAAVASTLLRLRRVRRHRALVRAANRAELVAGLSALAHGDEHPLIARSSKSVAPCVAFVFPGQGNQWESMGSDAYERLPAYRAEADRCAQAFASAELPSPLPYLLGEVTQNWSQTQIQGAQFIHAVSLAQQWRLCGVLPDITIGHSLGEVAAAYVAARITLHDAVALVGARATVVDRLTGDYAMAVLGAGVDAAQAVIDETAGWLEVSAVNGPSSTVVSGDHDAVLAAVQLARQRGMFTHQLSVDYPGHTSVLRTLRTDLATLLPRSAFRDGPVRFVGSTFGAEVSSGLDFFDYWYESLCNTARFDRAVAAAQDCGADIFVELSAHPSLLYPLVEVVDDESVVIIGSGHRDAPITDVLSANIATVATADPGHQWADAIPGGLQPPLRGFPNAPMRAVHLWAAPETWADTAADPKAALTIAVEDWQQAPSPTAAHGTQCGIAIVGDATGTLAQRLTDAVVAHHSCDTVPPTEADIVAVIAPALEQLDVTAAVEQIADRPDVGLPDYAAIIGPQSRAVWLLTAGGERVHPDDPDVMPAQAALAAMHRSVGFEFGDQTFGNLDLPSRDVDTRTASAVVDALLGEASVMALRANGVGGPRSYSRGFRRDAAVKRPLDTAALENVVITGGSGTIGLRYARHCIESGARTVILLSRNGPDPAMLAQLIARHGTEVHAPLCDITDRDALSAVAARYGGSGASLLIHTAGIAATRRRAELSGADVAAVCAAKVTGLALMAEVWPLRPECRILACSSVFGVWGGHGHAAYAASNRMLDVLAAQLRAKGLNCTALRWGLWQEAGVVDVGEIARTERSGLIAMEPHLALDASLGSYTHDPLIFAADVDRLRVFFESQALALPFDAPTDIENASEGSDSGGKPIVDVVCTELAATLHLDDPALIDPRASLIDLGLDSLLALDLRKRLRRAVGCSAPVAQMLGGITVNELIDAVRSGLTGRAEEPSAFQRAAAAGTEQLSATRQ
jgi:mycobactin polyketide synthetase MbtD